MRNLKSENDNSAIHRFSDNERDAIDAHERKRWKNENKCDFNSHGSLHVETFFDG